MLSDFLTKMLTRSSSLMLKIIQVARCVTEAPGRTLAAQLGVLGLLA